LRWIAQMDRVFLFGAGVFLVGFVSGAGILVIAGLVLETIGFVRLGRRLPRRQ
jgi:hypothetical protein